MGVYGGREGCSTSVLLSYTALVYSLFIKKVQGIVHCEIDDMEVAVESMRKCNPSLARISTAILETKTEDYTKACRYFQDYMDCMVPVFKCENLLDQFWKSYNTYSGPPYECALRNDTVIPANNTMFDTPTSGGSSLISTQLISLHLFVILSMIGYVLLRKL